MILNSQNVLKNFMGDYLGEFGKVAQVGVDLSVTEIREIKGGKLCQDGSKEIEEYEEVPNYLFSKDKGKEGVKTWMLKKGNIYSLTFEQSIKLDSKHTGLVFGRSTINRIGGLIRSSIFDPGFDSQVGATLYCFADMEIEYGARLAQFVVFENEEAEKYNGSYQKDKDIK